MQAISDDILGPLVRAADDAPPDAVFETFCDTLLGLGCTRAAIYVVDYDQVTLEPIAGAPSDAVLGPQSVTGSLGGRTFLGRSVEVAETQDGRVHVWAPVRERADRMGVVEMVIPSGSHPLVKCATEVGLLAGEHLHSVARYTDRFELMRRRKAMDLAAEMQWSMLPALTLETSRLSVAGTLEPAYEIGGDAFDYAVLDHHLHLCVLDAMGRGVGATLASALALGAYRFGRRQGMELPELGRTIDRALAAEWAGERFVTGHLAHLNADTGTLSWINAGHPLPLLIRDAHVVDELVCSPCPPFGLGAEPLEVCELHLQPADRVLLYTDGAVEARQGKDQLGIERFRTLIERELASGRPDSVVLRSLVGHVTDYLQGEPLSDDLTLVLLRWHPPAAPDDQ